MKKSNTASKLILCACLVPAIAAVGAFAAPVAAAALGVSGGAAATTAVGFSAALSTALSSLGGNLLASWLDRLGTTRSADKILKYLQSSRHPPLNHDVVRVMDAAAVAAIVHSVESFAKNIENDRNSAVFAEDLRKRLKKIKVDGLGFQLISASDLSPIISAAIEEAAGGDIPADASLDARLVRAVVDLLVPDDERSFPKTWRRNVSDLQDWLTGKNESFPSLSEVLNAFIQEALKTDDRFFRIVLLSTVASVAEAQSKTLEAVKSIGALSEGLHEAWQADAAAAINPPALEGLQRSLVDFRAELTALLSQLRKEVREEFAHDRAPPLTWPRSVDPAPYSLLYWDRRAEFIGRDDALAALDSFLDAPDPILWTVVTGPAGVGKSRLLLEALGIRREAGLIEAGFLSSSSGWLTHRRFETWNAPERTVIVIDYAAQSIDPIRSLIGQLASRQEVDSQAPPVRIILVDTVPYANEFGVKRRLVDGTDHGSQAKGCEWPGDRAPLDLAGLSPPDVMQITEWFCGRRLTGAEADRAHAALGEDPELNRPLFAAMMGLALRDGVTGTLSVATVTNEFLEGHDRHWDRLGVDHVARRLVAAATAGTGCVLNIVDDPELGGEDADIEKLQENAARITGDGDAVSFVKLEPDFVGGLFVLRHLDRCRTPVRQQNEAERLMRLAWRHGNPPEFLVNLARNFGGDASRVEQVVRLAAIVPEAYTGPWAATLSYVVFAFALAHADAAADRILAALKDLSADESVRRSYATALFAGGLTGELGKHSRSKDRLDELRALQRAWPEDGAVRERLANALFNASNDAGAGAAGLALVDELRALQRAWPEDGAVREQLAKALFNAFNDAGAGAAGLALVDELRALQRAWPEDGAVRERLANALVNAVVYAGAGAAGLALVDELRALQRAWPEDGAVRERLAKALFNAFNDAGAGAAGLALVDELRALQRAWPEDGAVREQLANALVNAVVYAGAGAAGLALVDELRALQRAWPEDGAVRERLAKALFNAFNDAGAGAAGLALVDELRALQRAWPEDGAVREQLAKALFNAVVYAGAGAAGLALVDELRALQRAWPEDGAVRERLAKALFNAFNDAGAGAAGLALVDELRALQRAWPEDAFLLEVLDKMRRFLGDDM